MRIPLSRETFLPSDDLIRDLGASRITLSSVRFASDDRGVDLEPKNAKNNISMRRDFFAIDLFEFNRERNYVYFDSTNIRRVKKRCALESQPNGRNDDVTQNDLSYVKRMYRISDDFDKSINRKYNS